MGIIAVFIAIGGIFAIIANRVNHRHNENFYYWIVHNKGIPYKKVKKKFKKFNKQVAALKKAGVPQEEIRKFSERFYSDYI
jgi:hypothetical protein